MSPSAMPSGVWTKLAYRKPSPTPEFLSTPISLYTDSEDFRDEREVFIQDIRNELDRFTIEQEGFEYLHDEVDIKDWGDEEEVTRVLLTETPELIKRRQVIPAPSNPSTKPLCSLGAKQIHLTASRIRHSSSTGQKSDTTPVYAIHGDATRASGLDLLHSSLPRMSPPSQPYTRVMLINIWRPLKTITRGPLAFMVPSSIKSCERHEQIFSRPPGTFKVFGRAVGDYWLDTASFGEGQEWVS